MIKASDSEDKAHVTFTTATPAIVMIKHLKYYQTVYILSCLSYEHATEREAKGDKKQHVGK